MNVNETLKAALAAAPGVTIDGEDAPARTLHLTAGPDPLEVLVTWDANGDASLQAQVPLAVSAAVRELPDWQRQVDAMVAQLGDDRPALVSCRLSSSEPPVATVSVDVLADGLSRHALVTALAELHKVRRLLGTRLGILDEVAVRTAGAHRLLDDLGAAMVPNGSAAPTHVAPDGGLPAWSAPDPSQPPSGYLDAGALVQLVEQRGGWAFVRDQSGTTHWVDAARLVARR